jgi:nucleoside-diphosphate-sugar epimerase
VYRNWLNNSDKASLVIIRPTVVFGENNRGNVYNLFNQISKKLFVIIGSGKNIKSIAYVKNVAAFIVYLLESTPGEHLYNYIDKPDFNMNSLVQCVKKSLTGKESNYIKIPYTFGMMIGVFFDFLSFITRKEFVISSIRVKKFCSDSQFDSSYVTSTSFNPPYSLSEAIENTIIFEFIEKKSSAVLFESE